jgi:ribosomal protein S6
LGYILGLRIVRLWFSISQKNSIQADIFKSNFNKIIAIKKGSVNQSNKLVCGKRQFTNPPKKHFINYYKIMMFSCTSLSPRKIFENLPLHMVDNQKFPSPFGGRGSG